MSAALTLDTTCRGDGTLVLIAVGEIDLSNIDAFSQALTDSTAKAAASGERLTVDLTAVEYLDSAAINALYHVADHIHLIVHPVLIRSLTISGLAELVTIESAATFDDR
ncbi:anti-anti-sigma regulatory factor (antagonist of anti-sigma factor) [Mycobacterium sp. JS623]|uniref:STAS domain-containing protein n=1 Tax=Mycobacterium sp. JS623 TaxID=212767 RepID=UPI0002A54FA5|nr:STAS domain-containing protein [Mycobacterium sp. JS623]AGB24437.1 anti-anti-sigma regulatory factor (antagonist of anti-sigma factor) [Mycobacterium sp. JS623]